jgi:hypothetical protein
VGLWNRELAHCGIWRPQANFALWSRRRCVGHVAGCLGRGQLGRTDHGADQATREPGLEGVEVDQRGPGALNARGENGLVPEGGG